MENQYHFEVKECCASCQRKVVLEEGERLCTWVHMFMESSFKCSRWQMSDGLQNAGKSGGVVRDIISKEIVIK